MPWGTATSRDRPHLHVPALAPGPGTCRATPRAPCWPARCSGRRGTRPPAARPSRPVAPVKLRCTTLVAPMDERSYCWQIPNDVGPGTTVLPSAHGERAGERGQLGSGQQGRLRGGRRRVEGVADGSEVADGVVVAEGTAVGLLEERGRLGVADGVRVVLEVGGRVRRVVLADRAPREGAAEEDSERGDGHRGAALPGRWHGVSVEAGSLPTRAPHNGVACPDIVATPAVEDIFRCRTGLGRMRRKGAVRMVERSSLRRGVAADRRTPRRSRPVARPTTRTPPTATTPSRRPRRPGRRR